MTPLAAMLAEIGAKVHSGTQPYDNAYTECSANMTQYLDQKMDGNSFFKVTLQWANFVFTE